MIAVIADDLTGAAELAGIGLHYQLSIEVITGTVIASGADLLVISTDTRSMNKEDAVRKVSAVTSKLASLKPGLVFKKVDSALRGHIAAEIAAQLAELKLTRALLVPANPALGRKIINGNYFLNDHLIHLSGFSEDPEFPVTTSDVSAMLGSSSIPVYLRKHNETQPNTGMVVGEVSSVADLHAWAARPHNNVLLAGGSGFFTAMLDTLHLEKKQHHHEEKVMHVKAPSLFISGTAYRKSVEVIKALKDKGGPVSYMPHAVIHSMGNIADANESWSQEILALLSGYGKAIVAIDPEMVNEAINAKLLREKTAAVVHAVYKQIRLNEIIIEGGSTASAVVSLLRLQRFFPVEELYPGVVRMKAEDAQDLHLTIKPGSYEWPKSVWTF